MALKMYGNKKSNATKVIGIAAGKGGVGKSSLTVNLGLALYKRGFRVGILDADLYGPSIRKMLPEEQLPLQRGEQIVPAISKGIALMSMAFFRETGQATVVRAPIANGMITQFIEQVAWGELDYLLIDFPPGTGDIQITLSQKGHLTGALIVTTPQEVALLDVRRCIAMFEQVKIPLIGVVENMSYYQPPYQPGGTTEKIYVFGKGGGEKLAQEYNVPFLGSIPIDPLICRCLDQGRSLFDENAFQLQNLFLELAKKVDEQCQELKLNSPPFVLHWEKEKSAFAIQWNDGILSRFTFAELQAKCPCAACEQNRVAPLADVKANQIRTIGRYALKIDFTNGCSKGIYEFDFLRTLTKEQV